MIIPLEGEAEKFAPRIFRWGVWRQRDRAVRARAEVTVLICCVANSTGGESCRFVIPEIAERSDVFVPSVVNVINPSREKDGILSVRKAFDFLRRQKVLSTVGT